VLKHWYDVCVAASSLDGLEIVMCLFLWTASFI
jgi:hypothetical protein